MVTATGETIKGELRTAIHYPAGDHGQTSKAFTTERPVFANDEIFQQLLAQGATVGAKPTGSSTPWCESVLLGFGPTLLLVGLFVLLMRACAAARAGLRSQDSAKSGPAGTSGRAANHVQ